MAIRKQVIKIQRLRYRLSSIKRYEPFERDDIKHAPFGIYIYFSMTGNSNKVYHVFNTEKERDDILLHLDQTFGI
jgi:hypothetical protein